MRKSVSKRIRVTKTGKMIRRKASQGHFRSKISGSKIRQKQTLKTIADGYQKKLKNYLTAK